MKAGLIFERLALAAPLDARQVGGGDWSPKLRPGLVRTWRPRWADAPPSEVQCLCREVRSHAPLHVRDAADWIIVDSFDRASAGAVRIVLAVLATEPGAGKFPFTNETRPTVAAN